MSSPCPLLTILLPNRGRSSYLEITLRNLSEVCDSRVEIVILENSEPDYRTSVGQPLSTVFRVEKSLIKLSMTKNWHRGISLARGKWICFIGSDDGLVTGNLHEFLDFLETAETDVVSTHPVYFQYPILNKNSWADLPVSKLTTWAKEIRYVPLAAVLFPQMKLDLPVPYNRCVVRSEILKEYATKNEDIEGVSPDDFLGQYIAQKCRVGTYLELAVFIQGGSERSNGYQVGGGIQGNDALDFMLDSASKFGVGLQRFSILCSYSLAFEHYARARNSLGRRTPRLATYFSLIWSELFCPDNVHHSQKRSLVVARRFFKPLHTFLFRVMRKFWMFENFNWHTPVKNQKFNLSNDMDVSTIARYISEST